MMHLLLPCLQGRGMLIETSAYDPAAGDVATALQQGEDQGKDATRQCHQVRLLRPNLTLTSLPVGTRNRAFGL